MNKIQQVQNTKRQFDITSIDDLEEYNYFLNNAKWKNGCPFIVSWPFLDVQTMISSLIVKNYINSKLNEKKFDATNLTEAWVK